MTYMVQDSGKLNLVLSHPDDVDTSRWSYEMILDEVKSFYDDMDSRACRLIELSKPPINNWPVYQVKTLPTWISKSGKFVLIGDAVHAMAFYLSMGVSLAVEDAAALSACLELHTNDKMPLVEAMSLFEQVRKPRAEAVRDASLHAGAMLHLPPGKKRDQRDAAAKSDGATCKEADGGGDFAFLVNRNSYGITDKSIRDWCYGYDVVQDIESRVSKRR